MAAKPKTPPAKKTGNTLEVIAEKGKSKERQLAEVKLSPVTQNAVTASTFLKPSMGEIDLSAAMQVMQEKVSKVQSGDTNELEATLTAQATALDAVFTSLAARAASNMGQGSYMQAAETYMRLALKAQAQCTRTIEVLAAMKNPPVVFAKQANIAHGHQQVNNGATPPAPAHTGKIINQPNELLEGQHGNQTLDTRTTPTTSGKDHAMAAVEAFDRG